MVEFGVGDTAMAKFGGDPAWVTVSISVGVALVRLPSVPEIVKLNVPGVVLASCKVNCDPVDVGVTTEGAKAHVAGAPAVQESATVPLYPFDAVRVPFHGTA